MFNNIYKNKTVLITGHTGFKGAWLSTWLCTLGATVHGISNDIPSEPSLFEVAQLDTQLHHHVEDIRNTDAIKDLVNAIKPDYIFHLAAQAIVKTSFEDPLLTFSTNAIGTASILDAVKTATHPCYVICITSDKCYENVEWTWGYRENDRLGGKDPYSASKACAENVIYAYYHSFFNKDDSPVKLCSTRAGNVIGGGDWAAARIVPDCFRAWANKEAVTLRNPQSTRPWQHVLEPLSGYLRAGQMLTEKPTLSGESYNFGPPAQQTYTVLELLTELQKNWADSFSPMFTVEQSHFHEANLLKLSCDKALHELAWMPTLNFEQTCEFTTQWYSNFYQNHGNMFAYTVDQINQYAAIANQEGHSWAGS